MALLRDGFEAGDRVHRISLMGRQCEFDKLTSRHPIARERAPVSADVESSPMHLNPVSAHRRVWGGPQVLVVTFIALLELAREHLLEVTQAEAFAPIYVRLAYAPA
jgi:chromatin segregation and condensation protein Rec8/ScpA/Scc1 (kleisin family)